MIGSVGKRKKTNRLVPFGDGIVVAPGGGLIRNYRPVTFFRGRAVEVDYGDFRGIRVPSETGSAIFIGSSYDLTGLPRPPKRFLVTRSGTHMWVDEPISGDVVHYRLLENIIIKELNMSYATGKADSADYKEYSTQASAWAASPFKGLPVNLDGGSLSPATCQDEVVYGIIHSVNSYTISEDVNGTATDVPYYDITVQIAEGDTAITHNLGTQAQGKPLFIQDYTFGGSTTFADAWDTEQPSSGFSHPLFLVNDADSLHYNGIVRPSVI